MNKLSYKIKRVQNRFKSLEGKIDSLIDDLSYHLLMLRKLSIPVETPCRNYLYALQKYKAFLRKQGEHVVANMVEVEDRNAREERLAYQKEKEGKK